VTEAGELVVAGRMDAQVKVRGMRIDPTDIERALGRLAGVREAAVAVTYTEGAEAELTAFIVPTRDELTEDDVRTRLLRTLPRNMVPARFVNTLRLPLSPHGKVDRAALADAVKNHYAHSGTTA
jgi:acyl-coenzyme A synthetase/AMP-(fatty) acid ligase